LLDLSLTKVNATEPERTAMKKIQDCYVENGLVSKVLDGLVMVISFPSPPPQPSRCACSRL
ncbi:hypothetical protein C7A10_32180, partial [Pseudomonas fluorescens]